MGGLVFVVRAEAAFYALDMPGENNPDSTNQRGPAGGMTNTSRHFQST
jgi:hypothetical protein